MTTNSPNPVDGDVQALIADCQAEIAELEKRLTTWGEAWIPYLQSKIKRQHVALSALTAEPVYQFIVNNPDKDGYIEWADCNPDYFSNEPSDSRRILYTSPPAQLLRPVEVPESQRRNATAQPVSNGWVKCSDRMPVQHQSNRYVPLNLLLNERTVVQGGFDDSEFWMEGVVIKNVTHWMPLPAAPGGQDD